VAQQTEHARQQAELEGVSRRRVLVKQLVDEEKRKSDNTQKSKEKRRLVETPVHVFIKYTNRIFKKLCIMELSYLATTFGLWD
jgi:hypothetical protein